MFIQSLNGFVRQVGDVAKHERKSKIVDTDSDICIPRIHCDSIIVDLNRSLKAEKDRKKN